MRWLPIRSVKKGAAVRIFCFHSAGTTCDIFRDFLADRDDLEVCALQLPGRQERAREPLETNARVLAYDIVDMMVAEGLLDIPCCFVAHSVGCWVAYTVMSEIAERQLPLPHQVFFSSFMAPNTSLDSFPWEPNAVLDDTGFQEEVAKWGTDPRVFQPRYWPSFRRLLRADFTLFDDFRFERDTFPVFRDVEANIYWASKDAMVSREDVRSWTSLFPNCTFGVIHASHMFILNKRHMQEWQKSISVCISRSTLHQRFQETNIDGSASASRMRSSARAA